MSQSISPSDAAARSDALVERLFWPPRRLDVLGVYVGDRLGLYRAARRAPGPRRRRSWRAAAGVSERYVREWLEQQAASGILERRRGAPTPSGATPCRPGTTRRCSTTTSLSCMAPIGAARWSPARGRSTPCSRPSAAATASPYADYGADCTRARRASRGRCSTSLRDERVASGRARGPRAAAADPPARVADVACGEGRSSIAIARGYPKVRVDGHRPGRRFDRGARELHLAGSGLEDRVAVPRCATPPTRSWPGATTSSTILEALHDMSYPVGVLAACRGLLADGGAVLVGDERVPDALRRRPATTSSASTTGSASCTACRWGWSARTRPGPARSCAPTPCASTRSGRASGAARSRRSRTTSSASTC